MGVHFTTEKYSQKKWVQRPTLNPGALCTLKVIECFSLWLKKIKLHLSIDRYDAGIDDNWIGWGTVFFQAEKGLCSEVAYIGVQKTVIE